MEKLITPLYQPGVRSLPAGFGPLKGANANGRVTGPCGDTMEFWLMIRDGRILRATFTTDGCGASIASGAAAARLAEGKTIEEAARLTPQQVETAVGSLPADHKHCPVLAVDTLRAALDQPRRNVAPAAEPKASSSAQTDRSKPQPPPPVDSALRDRLQAIRQKILVLSGKGGVGKSTVAANLAMSLALAGSEVGLLDVDIHGPSIPKLMGLEGEHCRPAAEPGGLQPVTIIPRLKVMSIGFLLQSPRDAVVWRGPLKYKIIEQFLRDVVWGNLDDLVIDSPPGTGDEPLSVAQLVGQPAGAIVVTTPQDVAVADVRRSITFCQHVHLQVLGVVENMSGFVCPHCGKATDLFKSGGGAALAQEMGVPFLGKVPLDPQVVDSGDAGTPFVQRFAGSSTAQAFAEIVRPILANLRPSEGPASPTGKS
jgi:Mrp family chromosome partitioning ATPase